jgi:hypothetical protein
MRHVTLTALTIAALALGLPRSAAGDPRAPLDDVLASAAGVRIEAMERGPSPCGLRVVRTGPRPSSGFHRSLGDVGETITSSSRSTPSVGFDVSTT